MEFLELVGLTEQEFILLVVIIVIVSLIDLVLKAMAMWVAAKERDKLWFVLLLIINSAGIVPILYLWHRGKLFARGVTISVDNKNPQDDT